MQGRVHHPDPRKFTSTQARCASTSTSKGLINLYRDEEWLIYEKLTEIRISSAGSRLAPFRDQPEDFPTWTEVKSPRQRGQDILGDQATAEFVFDKRADGDKAVDTALLPLRDSLFPNVPPYINFAQHDNARPRKKLPKDFAGLLKWKFTMSTPRVIIKILANTGYQMVNRGNDWSGIWNLSVRDMSRYRRMKSFQKVNSMPGSQNLGNKELLWTNLRRMYQKYGSKEYNFMPRTYVLPKEIQRFETMWFKHGTGTTWIIKPPAAGRGQGIKIVNQWWEIPKWHSAVIQRYITKPKLINGLKFDLRVYVLLTSVNPLRIYIYEEGLVRFASVRYVRGGSLNDKFMHLTNSSVNKQNPEYVINDGGNSFKGHKWSFATLWSYLKQEGTNVDDLWRQIKNIVVKTLVSVESNMNALMGTIMMPRGTCYELYGFDVLLDEATRPWLLEVNILPSLHTNSALDTAIKGPLVRNVLNIVGYQLPRSEQISGTDLSTRKYNEIAHDYRLYSGALTVDEREKQKGILELCNRVDYLDRVLEELTRDDLKQLIVHEDELNALERFEKIFPTKDSYCYFRFFEVPRYYDRLLDAWEHRYSEDRAEGVELLRAHCDAMRHLAASVE